MFIASISPHGSENALLRIWENSTGKVIKTIETHLCANKYCFSPDSKFITISSTWSKSTKIWSCETGELVRVYNGATHASYSPDGKLIIATMDNDIVIWDVSTGAEIRVMNNPDSNKHLGNAQYSPNGKHIVSYCNNGVRVWESLSGRLLHVLERGNYTKEFVDICPDSKHIVIASYSTDKAFRIYEIETGELLHTIYPMQSAKIIGADFRGIKHDDLTEHDLLALKSNGALVEGDEP
jgi:WD40 repeat protein